MNGEYLAKGERKMFILGIIGAGFVLITFVIIIFRLIFDLQLTRVQKGVDQSPLFRKKVNYLRKIEQARHIRYLLFICLSIGVALMLLIISFLILSNDYQRIGVEKAQLENRIENLESQQKKVIASIPLKNYPEEGIGLKEYEWDKLNKDSTVQKQIESAISQNTSTYFGSMNTVVSLSVPKTLTLQIKGQAEDNASKETIKKNIDDFAKEAEAISELADIHVRMVTSVDKEKQIVYSVNYSREKSEDGFTKKNDSEQNLKNDGGKG